MMTSYLLRLCPSLHCIEHTESLVRLSSWDCPFVSPWRQCFPHPTVDYLVEIIRSTLCLAGATHCPTPLRPGWGAFLRMPLGFGWDPGREGCVPSSTMDMVDGRGELTLVSALDTALSGKQSIQVFKQGHSVHNIHCHRSPIRELTRRSATLSGSCLAISMMLNSLLIPICSFGSSSSFPANPASSNILIARFLCWSEGNSFTSCSMWSSDWSEETGGTRNSESKFSEKPRSVSSDLNEDVAMTNRRLPYQQYVRNRHDK